MNWQRSDFELNVTEDAPTKDQLRTILEYVGSKKAGQLIEGARDEADALKKLDENARKFCRPVVSLNIFEWTEYLLSLLQTVDWNNGRAGQS